MEKRKVGFKASDMGKEKALEVLKSAKESRNKVRQKIKNEALLKQEIENEKKDKEFIENTIQKVINELSQDSKDKIIAIDSESDLIDLHFGFGMYIRNKYIYGKYKSHVLFMDEDEMSSHIIKGVWVKLQVLKEG